MCTAPALFLPLSFTPLHYYVALLNSRVSLNVDWKNVARDTVRAFLQRDMQTLIPTFAPSLFASVHEPVWPYSLTHIHTKREKDRDERCFNFSPAYMSSLYSERQVLDNYLERLWKHVAAPTGESVAESIRVADVNEVRFTFSSVRECRFGYVRPLLYCMRECRWAMS
jgi:hypothetical protein